MAAQDHRHSDSGAELASMAADAGGLGGLQDVFTASDVEAFEQVLATASDAKCFVTKSTQSQEHCRTALQSAYRVAFDSLQQVGSHAVASKAPAELVTQNFHVEQIWAQVDMLHAAGMKHVRKLMKHLTEDIQLLDESMEEAVDELISGSVPGGPGGRSSDDDETNEDSGHGGSSDSDGGRPLETLDYDAMLAGTRQQREGDAGASDSGDDSGDDASLQSSEQDGSQGQADNDDAGSESSEGGTGEEDKELLPTEDDFLRLEDMEKFVQHGEAAEAAGDLGGFDNFTDFLEGNEIGGDDGDADEEADEVDLYGGWEDSDSGAGGSGDDDDGGIADGSAIKYQDFFGRSAPYRRGLEAPHGQKAHRKPHENDSLAADVERRGAEQLPVGDADSSGGESEGEEGSEDGAALELSTHERRQRKIAAQITQIEEEAMQERGWHMRGEATAATRPKDSALEIDVDFERTMRPPPEPTFEAAVALEDVIKARILELRFDNVVRVEPAGPKKERRIVELDDAKAKQGLADEYEAGLKRTIAGTAEDRHAATRKEIKALFTKLSAKLDALSHLGLASKPIVTELEVKIDAPAIAMEEAAPVMMSTASLKAPEEAVVQVRKDKQLKEDDEQTQAERRQARASKKRVGKRKRVEKEEAAGVYAHDKGIKSAREDAAAEREARMASKKQGAQKHAKKQGTPTTSAAVFKQLQDEKNGAKVSNTKHKGEGVRSAALML